MKIYNKDIRKIQGGMKMKEKIKNFFQSERLRSLTNKFFNKKTFKIAVAIIAVVVVLRIGFCALFEVNGVVRKVDGNNITVANFFITQTVNTGDYPVNSNTIKVGDRIKITKNIQGEVLSIRDGNEGRGHGNNSINEKNQFNGRDGKGSSKGKH
jgi:hypothetical protein